jgi:drug/metabolite transporter (DMT)-like permease
MGVNFVATGVLGYVVLNELITAQWCTGAFIIMVGVFFVLKSTSKPPGSGAVTKK